MALLVLLAFAATRIMGMTRIADAISSSPGGARGISTSPAVGQLQLIGLDSGACISYPPTHAGSGQTVFIDAGHGGLDPGVVGGAGASQVLEKDATLGVATRLADLLRADGYRVVMARTSDTTVIKLSSTDSVTGSLTASAEHRDLLARAACANAAGASVLVSIHFDGFVDPSVGGTETFYDPVRPFAAASKRLATDLQAALVDELATPDRGVWTDDQLAAPTLTSSGSTYNHLIELGPQAADWVESPTQMPGALVEPLFVTNPAEAKLASDPTGQQRIAQALRIGLVKYLTTSG
jgi:N-acetylmuramoyl-L-alanine amidase